MSKLPPLEWEIHATMRPLDGTSLPFTVTATHMGQTVDDARGYAADMARSMSAEIVTLNVRPRGAVGGGVTFGGSSQPALPAPAKVAATFTTTHFSRYRSHPEVKALGAGEVI